MTRHDLAALDLDQFREARWRAGRAARGLTDDAPFDGDPLVELAEEIADAVNYLMVAISAEPEETRPLLRQIHAFQVASFGLLRAHLTLARLNEREGWGGE